MRCMLLTDECGANGCDNCGLHHTLAVTSVTAIEGPLLYEICDALAGYRIKRRLL
jgi:hypothetical protein